MQATHLVEVLSQDVPQIRPLKTDTVHVVVRDLDQLLQAEQPRMLGCSRGLDLFPRDIAQRTNEVDNCGLGKSISGWAEHIFISTHPRKIMTEGEDHVCSDGDVC